MKIVAFVTIIVWAFLLTTCAMPAAQDSQQRMYRLFLEVEDGDTIVYKGIHMRFLGVDTPEIKNIELGFFRDQPFGREAKNFTRAQLRRTKRITYIADGYDRYGRLLVHVFVDEVSLSLKIVEAGLGYETVSVYGDNGFPEIAEDILKASRLHPELPFENPYLWRRKNRAR
jgi:endonuclease YncB( thermonuclease family)